MDFAANYLHVCGLDTSGVIHCMGNVSNGALMAPTEQTFVDVEVANNITCGLDDAGSIDCWGIDVSLTGEFVQLATSEMRTCGVTVDGNIECVSHSPGASELDSVPPEEGPYQAVFLDGMGMTQCALKEDGEALCNTFVCQQYNLCDVPTP